MAVTCLCQPRLTSTASGIICPHTRPVSRVGTSFQTLESITTPAGTSNQKSPVQWCIRIRNTFTFFTEGINTLSYFETVPKRLKEMQVCLDGASFPHWCCLKAPLLLLPQAPAQWVILCALLCSHWPCGAHRALCTPALVMSFIHSKSPSKDVCPDRQRGVLSWVPGFSPCPFPFRALQLRSPSAPPSGPPVSYLIQS